MSPPICIRPEEEMALDLQLNRVTDENYEEYLSAPAAVIVFKIANCQKCDEFLPIVTEASQQYDGKIRFGVAFLHVPGVCREIKRKYRFESFPTTHFYKGGDLVYQAEEKLTPDALRATIQKNLL